MTQVGLRKGGREHLLNAERITHRHTHTHTSGINYIHRTASLTLSFCSVCRLPLSHSHTHMCTLLHTHTHWLPYNQAFKLKITIYTVYFGGKINDNNPFSSHFLSPHLPSFSPLSFFISSCLLSSLYFLPSPPFLFFSLHLFSFSPLLYVCSILNSAGRRREGMEGLNYSSTPPLPLSFLPSLSAVSSVLHPPPLFLLFLLCYTYSSLIPNFFQRLSCSQHKHQ